MEKKKVFRKTLPILFIIFAFVASGLSPQVASAATETVVMSRTVAGDFNGDGKDDYATMYDPGDDSMKILTYLSKGSSFSGYTWLTQPAGSYEASQVSGRMVAGDFNGDGKDDIAVMYDYGDRKMKLLTYLSTGTSFSGYTWLDQPAGSFDADKVTGRMVAGDYNGDGKDDIAAMYDYGGGTMKLLTYLSTGKSFSGATWLSQPAGSFYADKVTNRMVSGDFNGDGKDDIAAMYDYGGSTMKLLTYLSTGTSFSGYTWLNQPAGTFDAKNVTSRMVAGDFNGDGKVDIGAMFDYGGSTMKLLTYLSTGTSFSGYTWLNQPAGTFDAKRVAGRMVAGDFNGDKKADIGAMFDYGGSTMKLLTYLSTGSSFSGYTWLDQPAGTFDASRTVSIVTNGSNNEVVIPSPTSIWPVKGSFVVTDTYLTRGGTHKGIDISYSGTSLSQIASKSTREIVAFKSGKVVKVLNNCTHQNAGSCTHNSGTGFGGYGNCVLIQHPDGTYSFYAHLIQNSITVTENSTVSQGQKIAMMGNSGSVKGYTGIHLHFEVRTGNYPTIAYSNLTHYNPMNYLK